MEHCLPAGKLSAINAKWCEPGSRRGYYWEFDGVYGRTNHWQSYDFEFKTGLEAYGCQTFDQLVSHLPTTVNRPPHVVDLMGGAYFLSEPQNAATVVGIRIYDKDTEFDESSRSKVDDLSRKYQKIIHSPNRRIIDANLLTDAGWQKTRHSLAAPADLIVCRPLGPLGRNKSVESMEDSPQIYCPLYHYLFEQMLTLVNNPGGIIFTEVPDMYQDIEIRQFFNNVGQKYGLRSRFYCPDSANYQWRRYVVIQR